MNEPPFNIVNENALQSFTWTKTSALLGATTEPSETSLQECNTTLIDGAVGHLKSSGPKAQISFNIPKSKGLCYYAAFQKYDPMGSPREGHSIGGGANRVQGLSIQDGDPVLEGGLLLIAQLQDDSWMVVLPLTNRHTSSWLAHDGEYWNLRMSNFGKGLWPSHEELPMVSWACGTDVYETCRIVWEQALAHPAMKGMAKTREEESYPEIFEHLGWCSWEHYRRNISADLLIQSTQQLNHHHTPVRYVLVDDGYLMQNPNNIPMLEERLKAFQACPETFPDGFQPLTRLKNDGQIRWMGLWQNFNGYWGQIDREHHFEPEVSEHLMPVSYHSLLPKNDPKSSSAMYQHMIGFAKSSGFDFVKIDDQAQNLLAYQGQEQAISASVNCSQSLEQEAEQQLNGLINCMAHGPVPFFNSVHSIVNRCSEDYEHNAPWRAKAHLHNSYQNMLWMAPTVWGDHDMFHSSDRYAGQMMAVSKAMSGGPIYLSDAPDDIVSEYVLPLSDSDGKLFRPLAPAAPLPDSTLIDPFVGDSAYRVAAPLSNGATAVVLMNLTHPEKAVKTACKKSDWADGKGFLKSKQELVAGQNPHEILCYDWFNKTCALLDHDLELEIDRFDHRLYILSPINHGWALVGLTNKYLSSSTVELIHADENHIIFELLEDGPCGLWNRGAWSETELKKGRHSFSR